MKYVGAVLFAVALMAGPFLLGSEWGRHDTEAAVAQAFGCGRVYADNNDPALDAWNDDSPCYPAYKAWDKTEWHQGQK